MAAIKYLAVLPYLGMLVGIFFVNQIEPYVLGMPIVLAWVTLWVIASSVIMWIVYRLDPINRPAREDSR